MSAREIQLAWVAGIYEGEGTISSANKTQSGQTIKIAIAMTTEEVIRRVHEIMRVGFVCGPFRERGNRKPRWCWAVYRIEDIRIVLDSIWSWLSPRRKAQALYWLNQYRVGDRLAGARARQRQMETNAHNTLAFRIFGKRHKDLSPRELHRYHNMTAQQRRECAA